MFIYFNLNFKQFLEATQSVVRKVGGGSLRGFRLHSGTCPNRFGCWVRLPWTQELREKAAGEFTGTRHQVHGLIEWLNAGAGVC